MSSILKVDTIQTTAGAAPTINDLGLNDAGTLVQIVDGRTITYSTHSGTSYSNTNLAVTITPKFANSKLFFSVCGVFWWNTASFTSGEYFKARIVDSRTGASIHPQGGSHQSLWFEGGQGSWNTYDRTATGFTSIDNDSTATRTYTVQAGTYFGNYEVRCFEHTADNIIRVMEIAQ